MWNTSRINKIEKKSFLIIGIGINTLKSPNDKKIKSISLLECSNKINK